MRRCPLHSRCACSCQRVRLSAIAPVNRNRAVRAAPQHRRCATVFKVNVYPRFSVVGDVHSTDFDSASHRFDAVKRPVPALADKPAMFGQRRQFGQRGGFIDGVAVQYSAVVIAEIDRFRSGSRVHASTARSLLRQRVLECLKRGILFGYDSIHGFNSRCDCFAVSCHLITSYLSRFSRRRACPTPPSRLPPVWR